MFRSIAFAAAVLIAGTLGAAAQGCVDYDIYDAGYTYPGADFVVTYTTGIDEQDLYNSRGARLSTAAQVIRQDRANVHKFGLAGPADRGDDFFGRTSNRGVLDHARYVTYCYLNISQLKRDIVRGSVPGILDVLMFRMRGSGRYVVFLNVVG